MTKLSQLCYQFIQKGILVLLVLIPLAFSPNLANVFYLPKVTLFRSIILFLALAWLVEILEEKRKNFYKIPWLWPILILFFVFLFSTFASLSSRTSFWGTYERLDGFYTLFCYTLLFFLTATHFKIPGDLKIITQIIIWGSVPIAIYGIAQHFGFDLIAWPQAVEELTRARVMSTFGNPLDLGAYLVIAAIPFTLFGFGLFHKLQHKVFLSFALTLEFFCLAFTFSRSSWLAALVGIFIFLFLWLAKKKFKTALFFLIIFLAGLALLVIFHNAFSANIYLSRFLGTFSLSDPSSLARLLAWGAAGQAILASPWLGYGLGSFIYVFNQYYPPAIAEYSTQNFDYAHNFILDLGVFAGLPGIIAFLFLYFCFVRYGFKLWKSGKNWNLSLLFLVSSAAYVVQNLFAFGTPVSNIYFYFLLGLGSASLIVERNRKTEIENARGKGIKLGNKGYSAIYAVLILIFSTFIVWSNLMPLAADYYFHQAQKSWEWTEKENLYKRAVWLVGSKHYDYQIKIARSYLSLSKSLIEKKNFQPAEQVLRDFESQLLEVVERYPRDIEPKRALANLYLVWWSILPARANEAEMIFQETEKLAPNRQQTYWDWGKFYLLIGEKEKALAKYETALNLDPKVRLSYFELGQAYNQLGEKEKAEENFLKAKNLGFNK